MRLPLAHFSKCLVLAAIAASGPAPAQGLQPRAKAELHIVIVVDGLRPDSITAADTPHLQRLRAEGVTFANSHAVFPTVTRVNASSLASGSYPAGTGIMGNQIYIPAVQPRRAFSNDDARMLLRLDEVEPGRIVTAQGIAEILQAAGEKMVAVSSGSTGSALLLAPKAPRGTGTVINGDFSPGTQVAFPAEISAEVLKRFGPAPKKGGPADPYDDSVTWAMKVLRDYVLVELRPRVVFSWMTEPDHIQHARGAGAPESLASIRNDDFQIGLLLEKLQALGLRDRTNIIVVSDHGFGQTVHAVNVREELAKAGLMPAEESDEVVIASSGQAVALHVKNRDAKRIRRIAEFLQKQPWCGLVFTAGLRGRSHEGTAPGTFSLELAHLGGHERSPDILFTFPWSSARNRHGVPGTDYQDVVRGKTGPVAGDSANHGGIGPWTVTNTMLAWGPDFKRGAVVRTPTANVDVAPTLLYLLGHDRALAGMHGRAILEALTGGPDEEQVPMQIRSLRVDNGSYAAVLQISEVAGKRYIDKGWRLR
jgi:arylsulfatase A-like enzyme